MELDPRWMPRYKRIAAYAMIGIAIVLSCCAIPALQPPRPGIQAAAALAAQLRAHPGTCAALRVPRDYAVALQVHSDQVRTLGSSEGQPVALVYRDPAGHGYESVQALVSAHVSHGHTAWQVYPLIEYTHGHSQDAAVYARAYRTCQLATH